MHPVADDPAFAPLLAEHGRLVLDPAPDPFRRLVASIVGQQLSTASARAIRERLFAAVEVTPAALRQAAPEHLRALGLSRQKAAYVQNVARAFDEDRLTSAALADKSDEEVIAALTAIRGVGAWTAKMFLMFALARPDVFPVEDLGIRTGMTRLFGEMTRAEMVKRAERWRPYRSTASLYLWRAAG